MNEPNELTQDELDELRQRAVRDEWDREQTEEHLGQDANFGRPSVANRLDNF